MALFCDATLLVVRHARAGYDHPVGTLSDEGGRLTPEGHEQVVELASRVRDRRIARVFTSALRRAAQTAEVLGDLLGAPVTPLPGLEEYSVGSLVGQSWEDSPMPGIRRAWGSGDLEARVPGAESGREIVARYREALQTAADQHRGEAVVLVSHGGVMSISLPLLATGGGPDLYRRRFIPPCGIAEVAAGDDGWHLLSWPGEADDAVL